MESPQDLCPPACHYPTSRTCCHWNSPLERLPKPTYAGSAARSARLPLRHPQASELEATGPVQSVGLLVFIDYPTPIMSRVGRQVKNYHMPRLLSLEYPGSADRRKCYQMPQLRIFVVIEKRKEPENLSRNGSERRKALNTTSIADREKLLALLGVCLRQRNSVRRKCSSAARNDHDNSEIELP